MCVDSYWGETVEIYSLLIRSGLRETSVSVFENLESHSRDIGLRVRVIEIHHQNQVD